jgi:excisionase family DNA binding protein
MSSDQADPAHGDPIKSHRLLTVSEAAEVIHCHEETIRRAYLARQLKVQRFGVRSIRIDPDELRSWLARGAPTRAA